MGRGSSCGISRTKDLKSGPTPSKHSSKALATLASCSALQKHSTKYKRSSIKFPSFKTINWPQPWLSSHDFGLASIGTSKAFTLHRIFDNLTILKQIKFLGGDPKTQQKRAMVFWFLALLTSIADILRAYLKNRAEAQRLQGLIRSGQNQHQSQAKLTDLGNQNKQLALNLIKNLGDVLPAGQGSEFFPKVLKINLNDGQIGFGGLVSGLLSAYQAY